MADKHRASQIGGGRRPRTSAGPAARFCREAARLYGGSRRFVGSLLESSPAYFVALDADGRVLYANAAMRACLGYAIDEFEGCDLAARLASPGDREGLAAGMKAALTLGRPVALQCALVTRRGRERFVRWCLRRSPSRVGARPMLLLTGVDLTDERSERNALERERDETYRYLDLAGVMLVAIGSDERVTLVNAKACEVLEASEEEILGRNWFDAFLPERQRETVRTWFRRLVREDARELERAENPVVTAKGTERLIEWHNTVLTDSSGAVIGTLSSGIDTTDRRRAEQVQQLTYQIASAIHTALNLSELFKTIQLELGKVLSTENFFIALYDKDRDTISLSYFVDEKDQDEFHSFPAGKTLTAYVIHNNMSLLLTRQEADQWVAAGIVEMIGTPSQVWLGVPLRVRGEVVGALVVQSYTDPNEFGEPDREMLEFVSGQIGFAVEHKRAEEELRASEERNRAILDAVPDLMFQIDREGRFRSYNAPDGKLLALPPERFIGRTVYDVFSNEFGSDIVRCVRRAIDAGETQSFEYRIPVPMPDGEDRDFEARFASCGPDAALAVVRDVTERKRAERFLKALNQAGLALEQTFTPREAFALMARELLSIGFQCCVWLTDEAGERVSLGHSTFDPCVLREAERMGITAGRGGSARIDDVDVFRRVIRARETVLINDSPEFVGQLVGGTSREAVDRLVQLVGGRRRIYAPLAFEEGVSGILGVGSPDLTTADIPAISAFANQLAAALRKAKLVQELGRSLDELRRTQDQLLQAQKMEAVGRLAGGVAHDFNNLLTAISGYAELLLSRPALDAELRDDVTQIHKAGDQAAALTRQLLAFSRRQPLEPRIMDLNAVVVDMDPMLRRLIGEDIEFSTTLDRGCLEMEADPGQIEQVIINIVVNARDAMPDGGRLTLRTKAVELTEEAALEIHDARPGRFVCLSIEDTGCGIPKDVIGKIFEPFFSTKGPGKGTGLGLSVVYGIVRQHGGWLNVYSEPGRGAVFKVYLPASRSNAGREEKDERATRTKDLTGKGQRILVVEDEDAVREFASRALRESGYVVFEAGAANQAIQLFEREQGRFELVFSDVVLPDQSGIRLVDDLLARKPDLNVLLSSGYTDQRSQWPAIQEKGIRFLQKPYSLPDLLGMIKDIVEPG